MEVKANPTFSNTTKQLLKDYDFQGQGMPCETSETIENGLECGSEDFL